VRLAGSLDKQARGYGLTGFALGIPAGTESGMGKNRLRAGDGLFLLDLVERVFDLSALFIDRQDARYGEGFHGLCRTGVAAVNVERQGVADIEKGQGQDESGDGSLDERTRTHGDWILAWTLPGVSLAGRSDANRVPGASDR